MFVLNNEDYLPSHRRSSYRKDEEKWDGVVTSLEFMDVSWYHDLWDRYLDRNTNVFHCAGNKKIGKILKQWREHQQRGVSLLTNPIRNGIGVMDGTPAANRPN